MSRFFEICYDQYKIEMEQADAIYQRAGVMLIVLPVSCAAALSLGRLDLVMRAFERVDIFIFYVATLGTLAAITISAVFLFISIYPRNYITLESMDAWHKWRDDYQKYLHDHPEKAKQCTDDDLDKATFGQLCQRLVEAQPKNAKMNNNRRKAFRKSVLWGLIAFVFIGVQALIHVVLQLQGI